MPVSASLETKATIDEDVYVVLHLSDINSTIYARIVDENLISETTLPSTIINNLKEEGLENVVFGLPPEPLSFDPSENSITVEFYLSGADIVSSTFSAETMKRTCRVRTDWKNFEIDLDGFLLNFTEYFGTPISISPPWQLINYTDLENKARPAYYLNSTATSSFDPEFYFILPREATNVHVEEVEMIVFELPPSLGEAVLSSPFIILGAILVVNIVAFIYRSIRKDGEQEVDS
jgi:hypothetical protein